MDSWGGFTLDLGWIYLDLGWIPWIFFVEEWFRIFGTLFPPQADSKEQTPCFNSTSQQQVNGVSRIFQKIVQRFPRGTISWNFFPGNQQRVPRATRPRDIASSNACGT